MRCVEHTNAALSHVSLGSLPEDILVEISSRLDAPDFQRLSQTSRRFHTLSESPFIWYNLLTKLLHRARYVDLLALDQKPLSEFSLTELKQSILAVYYSEANWSKDEAKAIAVPYTIDLRDQEISLDQVSYITKFTSRHLIIPLMHGGLLGWDLKKQASAGKIEMPADSLLIDLALDALTRSLVCLVGNVAPVRVGDSFGMHVRLCMLRVNIPEPGYTTDLSFDKQAPFTLLVPFHSEIHILDASRRMLCVAFSCTRTKSMGVLLIFDWNTEGACIFDTGLPYAYGRSLTGVQLTEDGEHLIIQSEVEGGSIRRWYSLSNLECTQGTWNAVEFDPQNKLDPVKQLVSRWQNEPLLLSEPDTIPYLFWQVDQNPRHPYPNIPIRRSTVTLHVTVPRYIAEPQPSEKVWTVTQYYSDAHGPCTTARSFVTLSSPALSPNDPDEHGIPVMCISFNHFGWIEETKADGTKKRVMKLVTFPDPGTAPIGDLLHSAKSLDIPSEVLDNAYHVLLDETQGLVIVASVSDVLHVYHY